MTTGVPWSSNAAGPGWRGQGRIWKRDKPIVPSRATDVDRTCPQYFARSPLVVGLLDDLRDWKTGRLGHARRDMSAMHHRLLKMLEIEMDVWESYWLTEM